MTHDDRPDLEADDAGDGGDSGGDIVRPQAMEWPRFLATAPAGAARPVLSAFTETIYTTEKLGTPDLHLYCEPCGGERWFSCRLDTEKRSLFPGILLSYRCRNCVGEPPTTKHYFVAVQEDEKTGIVDAYKYGEFPRLDPKTPPRLLKLLGPHREMFLSGRRAELQGMGIGAAVYYRRVVEAEWKRIVAELLKVAEASEADPGTVSVLKEALNDKRFSAAVDRIKDAIPPAMRIEGQNPLKLLHFVTSDNLHERSEAECLEIAQDVREVLIAFVQRSAALLRREEKLKTSVRRLAMRQTESKSRR